MKKKFITLLMFYLLLCPVYGIEDPLEEIAPEGDVIEEIVPDLEAEEKEEEAEQSKARLFIEKIVAPKKIEFKNSYFNEFSYGVSYKGFYNLKFQDNGHNVSNYELLFEPFVSTKFGKRKNEIMVAFLPTMNTDKMDRKFWGIFSDLYYKRQFNENHSLLIGNSRTPVGYEGGMSAYTLPFVYRSQIAQNYGNAWAPGIRFQGDFGLFDYDLGGYSSTRNLQKLSEGCEFTGWVNYKPFNKKEGHIMKNWKISTGVNVGHTSNTYTVVSFGSHWSNDKWLATAEYALANGYNGSKGAYFNKSQGANFTLGYSINDKWQLMGRYDVFDPDINNGSDWITQYSAGINYYIVGNRLKLALNYVFEQNNSDNINKNMVYLLTQIKI